MKAVRIPAEGTPEVIDMPSTLEGMQAEVGGYIEPVPLGQSELMGWVNADGPALGMDRNPVATRLCPAALGQGIWIAGPMLVTGHSDTTFVGLTDETAELVAEIAITLKEAVR